MKVLLKTSLALLLLSQLAVAKDIYATFNVHANQEATLAFTASGLVQDRLVDVGAKVTKGQVLARLENSEQKAMLELAEEDYKNAQLAYNKSNNSFQRYKKVATILDQEKFDAISFGVKMARVSMQKAKVNIALRQAQFDKTILKAPFNGIVTQTFKEPGDAVTGMQVMPFIELMDTHQVKLILSFDSRYVNDIKVGQSFIYHVDGSDRIYKGKLSKVYPTVDTKTRKIRAEVITTDLKPGLFGQGTIKVN